MSCNCTSTKGFSFKAAYDNKGFTITTTGGAAVSSCGGEVHVQLTGSQDCASLKFVYERNDGEKQPAIEPMRTLNDCPCSVSVDTEQHPSDSNITIETHKGTFHLDAPGVCNYWWTLKHEQPECKIKIVVARS